VHSIALAFAQADLLPAALAAWTANIVFAGIGTALFLSARTYRGQVLHSDIFAARGLTVVAKKCRNVRPDPC
jgi:hypothetical protein